MMDDIDRKILEILKENARTKYVDIGEAVGLTEGAVRRRIEKMLEAEIIVKFTIESSIEFEGVVLIKTGLEQIPEIKKHVKEYAERIFELAGEYDIAVLIQAFSIDKLNWKVDKIRKTPGVLDTKTLIKLVDWEQNLDRWLEKDLFLIKDEEGKKKKLGRGLLKRRWVQFQVWGRTVSGYWTKEGALKVKKE